MYGVAFALVKDACGRYNDNVEARWIVTLLALLASACQGSFVEELQRELLFDVALGPMENQLALWANRSGDSPATYMRDGIIYIASRESRKLMAFSSYGDLIQLLYDPAVNPEPVSLAAPDSTATRIAVPWPLEDVGRVAVDSQKRLYVDEGLREVAWLQDADYGVFLTRVVRRFGRRGEPIDWLGQDGVGGTAFPYIHRLQVTVGDQLAVICRVPNRWVAFWFDADGSLLHKAELTADGVSPLLPGRTVLALEDVFPDVSAPGVYVFVSLRDQAGLQSREIHRFDLTTGTYGQAFTVPRGEQRQLTTGAVTQSVQGPDYEPLGSTTQGALVLLRREDPRRSSLLMVDTAGQILGRRSVRIDEPDLELLQLSLTPDGVLYALLGRKDHVEVVWWRTDRLLARWTS